MCKLRARPYGTYGPDRSGSSRLDHLSLFEVGAKIGQRIALKRRRQKRLLREEDKRRSWRQDRLSMSCVSCKEEAIVTLYLNRYKGRFMGAFSQPIRSQPSL